MSWEAWGNDDAGEYDHLLDAGWWSSEQATKVTEAIEALSLTTLYEGGKKDNGVSVEFLMRLNLLRHEAGLDVPKELVDEANRFFDSSKSKPS